MIGEDQIEKAIINCFSMDVEGFVESNIQSFPIDLRFRDKKKENYEIEKNMEVTLALLADTGVEGTFFFLGRLSNDLPNVIRATADAGHEIACHNYEHVRVFEINPKEFRKKLSDAKHRIEDVSGKQVSGFRAPDFSIIRESLWALDVLKELGFIYDSSIFPTGIHDVYGIRNAQPSIHKFSNGLIEFPLSTISLCGKRIPCGGGGYFRIYPISMSIAFMRTLNKQGTSSMFYIHPYEVGPEIPTVVGLSFYRRFRHYYNCENGAARLRKILHAFKFGRAIDILNQSTIVKG